MERMKMARGMEWTAPSGVRFAAPAAARMSLAWLVRTGLCFGFLAAFLQYEVSSTAVGYLPLAVLAFCALLVLCGRQRTDRVQHILGGGGLLFAAMAFGEAVSYTSHDAYSLSYGLVFIGVFLCARLILQEIGVPNVIRAYSQAAILTVCLSLISGRQTLFAGASGRFNGGTRAHPNLIGFILGGFFPVIVWRAMEEKAGWRKKALIGLSIVAFGMVFITGSRGTLFAVLAAGAALLLRGVSVGWLRRFRVRHLHIILFLLLIPLAASLLLQHNRIGRVGSFLVDFLSLTSSQRGLKSGLSGRTGIWQIAFRVLRTHDRWLFGFGYRMGDRLVGTIDNGYVQLLFESGLIAGGMILGSMLRVFFLLWKVSHPRENNAWTRYYAVLWCLMIVYFLNNVSTRYLFSFGSPFSLCVLFLMAASRQELIGGGVRARMTQKVKPPPLPTAEGPAWNRS
jgi:O-antigen ligase